MILGPYSFLDCFVFVVFLTFHLLLNVGVWRTLRHAIPGIAFLAIEVPNLLVRQLRFVLRMSSKPQSTFERHATVFEALALRCARYANANLPPDILQAFFHKNVVYPVLRFRMLRHLYIKSPVNFQEYEDTAADPPVKGIWIREDETKDPDFVLYYIHGGGFVMGSTHFYLEYLMAIQNLLVQCFHNPAIFAIEYSLAPGAQYPKQSEEVLNGYLHALSVAKSNDRVCVMGDSAGGSLGLNMLAELRKPGRVSFAGQTPAYMVLVSPWMTLASDSHRNTADDYLSAESLHKWAKLYAPIDTGCGIKDVASPSVVLWSGWKSQGPKHGYYIWFGGMELLASEIRSTVQHMKKLGAEVYVDERQSGGRNVHVWPVISFYLASDQDRRLEETRGIVAGIARVFLE